MFWIELDNSYDEAHRIGFGESPALLLIDFVLAHTNPSSHSYANGMRHAVNDATHLLSLARQNRIPIFHSNTK